LAGSAPARESDPERSAASGRSARSAILASEVVVVPVQPSPLDIWAVEKVVKLIE
jgi:cellulose biosynthesis protein BcsQ